MVKRVQKEFNCKFSTLYGQTEYCPVITQHHNNDSIEDICNTIGQPISHTEVSIRSINNNKICPSNTVGEICVRGPSTMLKYFAIKKQHLKQLIKIIGSTQVTLVEWIIEVM